MRAIWSQSVGVGIPLSIVLLTVSSSKRPTNFEPDSRVDKDLSGGVPRLASNQEPCNTDIERTLATLDRIRQLRERMKPGNGALRLVRQAAKTLTAERTDLRDIDGNLKASGYICATLVACLRSP